VEAMKGLCNRADILLPNITEAAMLTGLDYLEIIDMDYVNTLADKIGVSRVVLTGVGLTPDSTGVFIKDGERRSHYSHRRVGGSCHGTGDIYASAFVGAFMRGKSAYEAAKIAADYAVECIKKTAELENHWYGAAFEPVLGKLIAAIN